jgi:nicotinamidase-related amidase
MNQPPRRALIVIDVQNEYVSGNLRIEYPEVQSSLHNIGRAMDFARSRGIPVAVVQNSAPATSPLFAKGSPGWQLHDVVGRRGHDFYVEKTLPSAFAGTNLASWIAEQGIDTLTVVGYMTHNCITSTIIQALHAGLSVEFLPDAAGSVPYRNSAGFAGAETIHHAFTVVLQSRFAAVVPTEKWMQFVEKGELPPRESIYVSHQNATGLVAKQAAASV